MVPANPPMVAPVPYPGGVKIKPPFEMGVANFGSDFSLNMTIYGEAV